MASAKEVAALFKLDGPSRYGHLIRRIADFEEAWSLRSSSGWAALTDDNDQLLFPLWPHAEYAEACRGLADADATPTSIPLEHLLGVLLPQFISNGTVVAVFPTPAGQGILTPAERLRADLLSECQQYE
jgi:hypothetical protein